MSPTSYQAAPPRAKWAATYSRGAPCQVAPNEHAPCLLSPLQLRRARARPVIWRAERGARRHTQVLELPPSRHVQQRRRQGATSPRIPRTRAASPGSVGAAFWIPGCPTAAANPLKSPRIACLPTWYDICKERRAAEVGWTELYAKGKCEAHETARLCFVRRHRDSHRLLRQSWLPGRFRHVQGLRRAERVQSSERALYERSTVHGTSPAALVRMQGWPGRWRQLGV
jgi:hypothetical protein